MKGMHSVSFILVIVGGVNWGLVGLGNLMGGQDWNLVTALIGSWSEMVANLVYVLVGASAVYLVTTHKKDCRYCNPSGGAM